MRALPLLLCLLTACGGSEGAGGGSAGGGSAGGGSGSAGGGSAETDAGVPDGGTDAGRPDAGSSDAGAAFDTSLAGLQAFFQSKAYQAWPSEPAPHPSTGPHGGNVRTWVNPTLEASLDSNATSHPIGSVTVKELYGSGTTTVTGVAIDVKDTDGGWVFFEGFAPSFTGYYYRGTNNLCGNCHSAGRDYVLTTAAAIQ